MISLLVVDRSRRVKMPRAAAAGRGLAGRGLAGCGLAGRRDRPGRAGAARHRPAGRDPRHQPGAGRLDHRHNRPGHDQVPRRGAPGRLGRAVPADPPVRPPHPERQEQRQRPAARLPRPGRHDRGRHRHLPRRTLSPDRQPPRRRQGPGRRRPVHPGHHLAPARRPPGPLRRPRTRLARKPDRQDPQGPQPHSPARNPRIPGHPLPRPHNPTPHPPAGHRAGSPGAAARPAQLPDFPVSCG